MKQVLITVAFLAVLFCGCEKETVLTLDQSSISFTDAGGSQTVSLTANKPWTVSTNQSWCKVSPSGGEEAASSRVTITCDANTSYDERNCTVTFTCAELTKTVSVTQATNNGLLVSQTLYELTKAAQQLNIEVKANVKFSVEIDADCKDWITYNTTKGLTTNMVVLDIAENKSYDGREGKVTIKQNGGNLSSTITIKQSQLDGLFISTPEYNLSNEKHTLMVEVSTNVEFDVTSEADWVKYVQTKGLNSKQIILEVAENDTYDQRETKVNVKQKNGDIRGTIVIKQDEKYGILVTQSEYNLSNEAQTIEVEVKYNVDFDVVIPDDCKGWIKQVSTKSLYNKIYTFSIAKNTTYVNREGAITFKQKNGGISTTVAIKQRQTDYLQVEKTEYTVDIEVETISINVTSNVEYSVVIAEDARSWLSRVETKGLSKDKIQIAVAAGDEDTNRTGEIEISYGKMVHTIHVCQNSKVGNTVIPFADKNVKDCLIAAFDTNKDGELSIREAKAVKSLNGVFGNNTDDYTSFDEFQYFTGIKEIPNNMFSRWRRLSSMILPDSIISIGHYSFEACGSLTNIIIPKNVKTIGNNAFIYSGLTSIVIPDNVTSIGARSFSSCRELTSIDMANGITLIEKETFQNCSKLSSIKIPASVTSIEESAFRFCDNLTLAEIPEGVTKIGASAFASCTALKTVTIPGSVNEIGDNAFAGCTNLSSIEIVDGVTSIGTGMFQGTAIKTVKIPGSVKTIGSIAFIECYNLTSVELSEGVTRIGTWAFQNCTNLTRIDISTSVTSIGGAAFENCINLVSLEIPENVTSIGERAFRNCENLISVNLPKGLKSINESLFEKCRKLGKLTLPKDVSYIATKAFCDCINLSNLIIMNETPPKVGASDILKSCYATLYVPRNSIESYKTAPFWKDYASRIQAIPE